MADPPALPRDAPIMEARPVRRARVREVGGRQLLPPRPPREPAAPPPAGSRRNPVRARVQVERQRPVIPGPRPPGGGAQRVLFITWAAAVGLRAYSDVRSTRDWPCPGPILRISAAYLILGVVSEFAPRLAATFGVGLLLAYMVRVGGREVQQHGTFFGIPTAPQSIQQGAPGPRPGWPFPFPGPP